MNSLQLLVLLIAPPPATQPATVPAAPDVLAGPAVVDEGDRELSIVKRSFDGSLEDVGAEPEFAALHKLQLTDEQRNWLEVIQSQRLAAFDELVRANYGLILELATLQSEPDRQKKLQMIGRTREAFEPFTKRGSLAEEMKGYLTQPQVEQVNRMMEEYRTAKASELKRNLGADAPPRQVAVRAWLDGLRLQIRESIERQVGLEKEQLERIAADLDLTADQKAKAEAIFQPIAVQRLQNINRPEDRAAAFRAFEAILTSEQRHKALEMIARSWKAAATQPATTQRADGSAASAPTMP